MSVSKKIFPSVEKTLFQSPHEDDHKIYRLITYDNIRLFDIEHGNISVSYVEINPVINLHTDKIIIFSHGTGVNLWTMSKYLVFLANSLNVIVVSYDYPGYGLSKGIPSEENCYISLELVINIFKPFYKILLIGQSLGSGVVVEYISTHDWLSPVILISPYTSIPNLIPLLFIRKNNFNFLSKIKNVKCPVLIIHGVDDKIVPITNALKLNEALKTRNLIKNINPLYLPNVGHLDINYKIPKNIILEILNGF